MEAAKKLCIANNNSNICVGTGDLNRWLINPETKFE